MINVYLLDDVLSRAKDLMLQQRFDDAIKLLSDACRGREDVRCVQWLAQCRHDAYMICPPTSSFDAASLLAPVEDPFNGMAGIPEIRADQLDSRMLAAGINYHGALLVRGLVPESKALTLAEGVRRALDACQAWHRNAMDSSELPWYSRIALPDDSDLTQARVWVEEGGWATWAADSPRMLFELVELFKVSGVIDAICGYFGERPMLSVGKSTLRCVPSTITLADWHQDGAFMGSDIRSVNTWLSLSHCGQDASGLECLPRRLSRILPTGSHGAYFNWSVGAGMVDAVAEGQPTVSPVFAPGDALLFDHFFLHRTGIPMGIAKDRYAIESWFFAPSAYPAQQVPLWL